MKLERAVTSKMPHSLSPILGPRKTGSRFQLSLVVNKHSKAGILGKHDWIMESDNLKMTSADWGSKAQ